MIENKELINEILYYMREGMPLGIIDILEKLGATQKELQEVESMIKE